MWVPHRSKRMGGSLKAMPVRIGGGKECDEIGSAIVRRRMRMRVIGRAQTGHGVGSSFPQSQCLLGHGRMAPGG